jgi:hypothetical protein
LKQPAKITADQSGRLTFLQVAQTISVNHGALAYLLGINALRASEASAVRIGDYRETLRGHRVLHLVGKGSKPATMPLTVPVLRVLEACRGERTEGPLVLRPMSGRPIDRRDRYRMVLRIAKAAGITRHISPHSLRHAAITNALDAGASSSHHAASPRPSNPSAVVCSAKADSKFARAPGQSIRSSASQPDLSRPCCESLTLTMARSSRLPERSAAVKRVQQR